MKKTCFLLQDWNKWIILIFIFREILTGTSYKGRSKLVHPHLRDRLKHDERQTRLYKIMISQLVSYNTLLQLYYHML